MPDMGEHSREQRDRPPRLRTVEGTAAAAGGTRPRSRLPPPGVPRCTRHAAHAGRSRGPSSPTPTPQKREKLIDELLERPEFAEYWAQKWSDLLRNEEKALDSKGVAVFYRWIAAQLAADRPLNEFARDILAATGSTYANPPANFWRAVRDPLQRAESVAQVFLGIRVGCAKCHNHPFDRWTIDEYYGFATSVRPHRLPRDGEQAEGRPRQARVRRRTDRVPEARAAMCTNPPHEAAGGARVPRREGPRVRSRRRPPDGAGRLGRIAGQPVLREGPGEPHLAAPDGPRAGGPERRLPRHQPARPTPNCSTGSRRTSRPAASG